MRDVFGRINFLPRYVRYETLTLQHIETNRIT